MGSVQFCIARSRETCSAILQSLYPQLSVTVDGVVDKGSKTQSQLSISNNQNKKKTINVEEGSQQKLSYHTYNLRLTTGYLTNSPWVELIDLLS